LVTHRLIARGISTMDTTTEVPNASAAPFVGAGQLDTTDPTAPPTNDAVAIPDLAEQRRLIKTAKDEYEESGPVAGNMYYLVSTKWWRAFMAYVGWDYLPSSNLHPGEIHNEALVEEQDGHLVVLRSCVEVFDFIFLPENAWKSLQSWYAILTNLFCLF
jgi:hypothetical protein